MKKLLIVIIAALALPSSAFAQASLVKAQKDRLGLASNLSRDQLFELAKAVATAAGGQLLVPTGDSCRGFSCDKICLAGRVIDYLGDSEGSAAPAWSDIGPVSPPLTCQNVPGGTPPPLPPPPSDHAEILKKLGEIEAGIASLRGMAGLIAMAVARIEARPVVLPPMEFPVYSGRVLGQVVTLKPVK